MLSLFHRRTLRFFMGASVALTATLGTAANPNEASEAPTQPVKQAKRARPWCAPELETRGDICYVPGPKDRAVPRTLVIFLHGLVGDGTIWQWDQQRLMARMAEAYSFSALIPRGELGIGPGRAPDVRAWPTTTELEERLEAGMIDSWWAAKRAIERKHGAFERVLVFGFSNGAYFAASLALRGRLDIDGYGVFAGGSGGKLARVQGLASTRRVPIFVGYGKKDPNHRGQRALVSALKVLGWKHRAKASDAGHTVTDEQIRGALRFLRPEAKSPEATDDVKRRGPSARGAYDRKALKP